MKIVSAVVILSLLLGCQACSKKTTSSSEKKDSVSVSTTPASVKTDTSVADTYRFLVTFYSRGEGTEGGQIEMLEKFIAGYGKKINQNIAYEKSHWGREGEVNYCMKLKELSTSEQEKFILGAKDALKSAQRVHFSENTPCGHDRRRQ